MQSRLSMYVCMMGVCCELHIIHDIHTGIFDICYTSIKPCHYLIEMNSTPKIIKNIIKSNQAKQGGGIYFESAISANIASNIISENKSSQGGAIFFNNSIAKITNSVITKNQAYEGSEIYCAKSSVDTINNTIVGNYYSPKHEASSIISLCAGSIQFCGKRIFLFCHQYSASIQVLLVFRTQIYMEEKME